MAFGDIRFTEQQRRHLYYLLMTLVFGQAGIGLVLFLLGVCVSSSVGTNLHSVDRVVVNWVFAILAMYGLYILIHNLVGAKLCSNFIRFAEDPGTNFRLFIWAFVGIIEIGVGCILASVCVATADHLVSQTHRSLYQGMMQYLTDPAWKVALDQMQMQMKCCGIESFTDWYKTYWMHHDVLDENSPIVLEYAELDGRVLPPVVPWSCCRIDAKSPCYHDPLQLPNPDQDLVSETLYDQGCLTAMKGPVVGALFSTIALVILLFTLQNFMGMAPILLLQSWDILHYGDRSYNYRDRSLELCVWLAGIIVTGCISIGQIAILQAAIIVLSRLAFTAARNAVALGDRYGPAPGWLYGRLDFGNATGPNLCQIYRKCSGRGDPLVDLKPLVYTSDTD